MSRSEIFDAAVIGGGPAGSATARLLAQWGHSVVLLTKPERRIYGLAESLPPSTRKVLAAVGALERVDRAGFCRSTGNTVWWGAVDRRVEHFENGQARGYQVFRPELDRLLLDCAAESGAIVCRNATVQRVRFSSESAAHVDYQTSENASRTISCRMALDCSGRAGVIARTKGRRNQPRYRTQALIGVWRRDSSWELPDETHTLVETYDDGWAWSIPTALAVRHVAVMIDPHRSRGRARGDLAARYTSELVKAQHLNALVSGAALERVWACDSSLYAAEISGGPQFLLIGDAASFIDPLSSYGVKKALASAWIGAVVAHTCLRRPALRDVALDFHAQWEQRVYATHLRRVVQYAREAAQFNPQPFWTARATTPLKEDGELDESRLWREPEVVKAHTRLRESQTIELRWSPAVRLEPRGAIRGHEVVLEPALIAPAVRGGLRFLSGVNVPALVDIVGRYRQIPDLFDAYCRANPPVPLPNLLGALAVLVAKGVLVEPS